MPGQALPNAPESLAPKLADGTIPMRRVWGMLAARSLISGALLLLTAIAFMVIGRSPSLAFSNSAAWWLWFVTFTNAVVLYMLVRFSRLEGLRLRDVYFARRSTWKGDLGWLAVGLVVTAIISQPPGTALASLLWGDPAYPNDMLFQPLPLLAVYPLFLLMPTIHALTELPTYWGYVAPRLRAAGWNRWVVIALVGAVLSLQHLFFSFQLDWRYGLWLAVKFLPFALWTGFLIDRRPTVLPYMMAGHFLLDALLPLLVYMVSTGQSLG